MWLRLGGSMMESGVFENSKFLFLGKARS